MGIRFSRLHFFKRFDINNDFVLLRNMTIGGETYEAGTMLDKSLLPAHKIKNLFNARKIAVADSVYENTFVNKETVVEEDDIKENLLTNDENHDTVVPQIVQAGPAWKKVMLGDEQLGKSVRTDEEAQEIIDEWLAKQKNQ